VLNSAEGRESSEKTGFCAVDVSQKALLMGGTAFKEIAFLAKYWEENQSRGNQKRSPAEDEIRRVSKGLGERTLLLSRNGRGSSTGKSKVRWKNMGKEGR